MAFFRGSIDIALLEERVDAPAEVRVFMEDPPAEVKVLAMEDPPTEVKVFMEDPPAEVKVFAMEDPSLIARPRAWDVPVESVERLLPEE